jgi:5-methylcytosine-specific restriction protein A
MWQPDIEALADQLSGDFGLSIDAISKHPAGGWPAFELRPADIPREISFGVHVSLGWRSIAFALMPGSFAGPLVAAMGEAGDGAKQTFAALAETCARSRGSVSLNANGAEMDVLRPESWPSDWHRVSLGLVKSPAVVNTEDYGENDRELAVWTRRYFSLAMALMPVEELEHEAAFNPEGLPEGARIRIETNRYERSRINRAACIELHGDSCLACDFNFGETYGEAGRGFIHVHHVTPVSRLGEGYLVNPATDLVPLCPNCHAMAHRFDPPASVGQLRQLRAGNIEEEEGVA